MLQLRQVVTAIPVISKQRLAIVALSEGLTVTSTAQAAGVSRATVHRWMQQPLFRAELEETRLEAAERAVEAIRQMNERHIGLALLAQEKALQRLIALDPEELSPMAVMRYFVVAVKIERLARGVGSTPTSISLQVYDNRGGAIAVRTYDEYAQFNVSVEVEDDDTLDDNTE